MEHFENNEDVRGDVELIKREKFMSDEEYAKQRMKESSKLMGRNTDDGQLYEFHKGQFLAFREIIDPRYRKGI